MPNKAMKYEAAMHQLESIVSQIEEGELDIDSLCEQLKQAQQLLQLCKDRLTKTQAEMQKILGEEES